MDRAESRKIDPERLNRLEHLLDRQDILDCLIRFSRGMDRFDRELFLSAFHADAIIDAGVFVGGPEKLYEWAADLHAQGQSATQHDLLNHCCEIDGDVAHSETYYWVAGGRYIDRLERRSGTWKIALRCNAVEWSGMIPTMAVPFENVPDVHENGAPSRSKEDLSYRRPLTNRRQIGLRDGQERS